MKLQEKVSNELRRAGGIKCLDVIKVPVRGGHRWFRSVDHFNFASIATAVEEVISSVDHLILEATAYRERDNIHFGAHEYISTDEKKKNKYHQPCSQEPHDSAQSSLYLSFFSL